MAATLSTTAHAVLGLLAMRPMTAYELTQQMQRSLDYCWPTSERSLYDQPERLVAAGYAEVVNPDEEAPRRYVATVAGREELGRWLALESAMPKFQNEPLLRVLLADQGTVEDLHRVLGDLRAHVAERWAAGAVQMQSYLDGGGLYPERTHIVTIVGDLITRILAVLDDWATDTERLISTWTNTTDHANSPEVRELLCTIVARTSEVH